MNYCLQIKENDCGFACVKMMLAYFKKNKNYIFLNQNLDKEYYSMLEIKNIAMKNGLFLEGYQIDNIDDIKIFPCVGHILNKEVNHFILIQRITKNYVYYFDPVIKNVKIRKDEFIKTSDNNYLIYEKIDNSIQLDKQFKYSFNNILSLSNIFIQLISIFLLSFMTDNILLLFIISIIIFVASNGIGIIIENYNLKKFDKTIIYPTLSKCNNNSKLIKKGIINEYSLKRDYVLNYKNQISNYILLTFVAFIIVINVDKYFIGIIAFTLINFICFYLEKNYYNNRKIQINNLEESSDKTILDNYYHADNYAYQITNFVQILNYVKLILVVIYALISGYITKNYTSTVYIIFLLKLFNDKMEEIFSQNQQILQIEKEINYHLAFNGYLNSLDKLK